MGNDIVRSQNIFLFRRTLDDAREEMHGLQITLEMEKSAHNEARRELGATKADLRAADGKLQEKVQRQSLIRRGVSF